MNIRKTNSTSLNEKALLENAMAQAETNAANIDYLAMMADIEIPTEEGTEVDADA